MGNGKKMLGEDRRAFILNLLKRTDGPITGSELAAKTNVSRQVIVGDITLLKAREQPIIATSRGYLFLPQTSNINKYERIIASCHSPDRTEEELQILVDHGVTVKDVKIEHPVYGDLTASIMVSNRSEVAQFIKRIKETNAAYLSELTDGYHLHTISSLNKEALDNAEQALKAANFIVENS